MSFPRHSSGSGSGNNDGGMFARTSGGLSLTAHAFFSYPPPTTSLPSLIRSASLLDTCSASGRITKYLSWRRAMRCECRSLGVRGEHAAHEQQSKVRTFI